ncbi:hypothetical protein R1sor_007147 [Riccia sorocarpa]|uniref:MYND-type domain-containing protein n=1 Tax=Riccia sorocarpa TaxID=122646 RepID=A0ABD3HRD6_9MARC
MAVIEEHSDGEETQSNQENSRNSVVEGTDSGIALEQAITSLQIVATAGSQDDSEEEEDGEEDKVWGGGGLKGFLQKPEEPWKILRQYFPSKAGGAPAWLDPLNVPRAKQGSCGICDKPLQFVLQVYAPVDDDETAFHRTLYVFMCTSLACLQQDLNQQGRKEKRKRSIKILRNQLPRRNNFYSSEAPKTDGSEAPLSAGAPLCSWCGTWKGDKICGGCKQTRYCSQTHQMDHWRGSHASVCREAQEKLMARESSANTSSSLDVEVTNSPCTAHPANTNLWPEFELIVDENGEDEDEASDGSLDGRDRVGRLLSEYENTRRLGREQFSSKDVQEVEETSAEVQHWAAFQVHVSKTPEQVIWYLRSADAKPLWPRLDCQPKANDIPVCSRCGGERIFEFQILPQLLYFFKIKDDPDSLDWGTIAVYSCGKSCPGEGYCEEFAWVQPGFS